MGVEMTSEDVYCPRILIVLSMKEKMRFNELHNELTKMGIKISKPSLLDHLQHLIERKYVIRKEEGIQHVTYRITPRVSRVKKIVAQASSIEKGLETEKKKLFSMPERTQIEELLAIMTIRKLNFLKNWVQYLLSKTEDDKFAYSMQMKALELPISHRAERWVVEKCVMDETYRKKIFGEIDVFLGKLEPDDSGE